MIISYEQLQENFGGSSPAEVAVRLGDSGVKFLRGKSGRPFTTLDALNSALLGDKAPYKRTELPLIEPEENIIEVD